jgi:hypothetical protein
MNLNRIFESVLKQRKLTESWELNTDELCEDFIEALHTLNNIISTFTKEQINQGCHYKDIVDAYNVLEEAICSLCYDSEEFEELVYGENSWMGKFANL